MRIDSHQHFWRIGERAGGWPPPALAAIHRDFVPADLGPTLKRCGIDGTVLVQSMASLAETEALLELAAATPFVLGVVGWVDMTSADAAQQIARLARNPWLKGLRPMWQDQPGDAWANDPAHDRAAQAMQAHALAFDALVLPPQLPGLLAFAQRHPQLPIVIDHAAKPGIARGAMEPWREDIARLAALPNLHCKLSGLLTEAGPNADAAVLAPYVEHLFASFGAGRLMWGSDWPVLELAADYDAWLAISSRLCRQRADAAGVEAIFGVNAQRFYRLG
jgi:L-fuconolactonase